MPLLHVRRFWGTPIPIWASEDGEEIRVIGSIAELEEIAGRKVGVVMLQNLLHLWQHVANAS
jgi:isoleucyl-tRNA synthetase